MESKWKNIQKEETRNTRYGQLNLNEKRNRFLRDKTRKIDTAITRIKIGHTRLNSHLHRMKMTDNIYCRNCHISEENINHLIFQCPKYYSKQQEMKYNLQNGCFPQKGSSSCILYKRRKNTTYNDT